MKKIILMSIPMFLLSFASFADTAIQMPKSASVKETNEFKHREHRKLPKDVREALKACKKETGVKKTKFKKGERLSKEDRLKMKQCMESKGKSIPEHKKHEDEKKEEIKK